MNDRATRGNGPFIAVQALWGASLLLAPRTMLRVLGAIDDDRTPRRVLRVLGARHLLQAIAEKTFGKKAERFGAITDGLHALTSYVFALVDVRWRRAAVTDAVITSGLTAVGWLEFTSLRQAP